jgi:hypothetical protein
MGTAMRFFVVLAGLGFMVFALAMIGPSLYDVFSATDLFDDFWGYAAVLLMLAAVAAAPFYVGVRLVRKGVRGGAALVSAAPEPPPAPIVSPAPEVRVKADAPSDVEPSPVSVSPSASTALDPAAAVASPIVHRPTLAIVGLAVAFLSAVILFLQWIFVAAQPPANDTERDGMRLLMMFTSVPLLVGLWLARRGDPGIGRRFLSDLGLQPSDLRRPAGWRPLLRTSFGLAIAIYVVAAPLMRTWRAQSAEIGITALAFYSLIDPIQNMTRPSWLSGAVVSFGVGMALFLTLMLTAGMLRHLGNDQYNFFFPLLLYIPMMGLTGVARLVDRLWRSD